MQFTKSFSVEIDSVVDLSDLGLEIGGLVEVDSFDFTPQIDVAPQPEGTLGDLFATGPSTSTGYSSVSGSASAGVGVDGTAFAEAQGSVYGNAELSIDVTAISFDAVVFDFF
ncbi:MAG: hypothetical protein AAFR93_10020 [Pseudomonadota bacterium]